MRFPIETKQDCINAVLSLIVACKTNKNTACETLCDNILAFLDERVDDDSKIDTGTEFGYQNVPSDTRESSMI